MIRWNKKKNSYFTSRQHSSICSLSPIRFLVVHAVAASAAAAAAAVAASPHILLHFQQKSNKHTPLTQELVAQYFIVWPSRASICWY